MHSITISCFPVAGSGNTTRSLLQISWTLGPRTHIWDGLSTNSKLSLMAEGIRQCTLVMKIHAGDLLLEIDIDNEEDDFCVNVNFENRQQPLLRIALRHTFLLLVVQVLYPT